MPDPRSQSVISLFQLIAPIICLVGMMDGCFHPQLQTLGVIETAPDSGHWLSRPAKGRAGIAQVEFLNLVGRKRFH